MAKHARLQLVIDRRLESSDLVLVDLEMESRYFPSDRGCASRLNSRVYRLISNLSVTFRKAVRIFLLTT